MSVLNQRVEETSKAAEGSDQRDASGGGVIDDLPDLLDRIEELSDENGELVAHSTTTNKQTRTNQPGATPKPLVDAGIGLSQANAAGFALAVAFSRATSWSAGLVLSTSAADSPARRATSIP